VNTVGFEEDFARFTSVIRIDLDPDPSLIGELDEGELYIGQDEGVFQIESLRVYPILGSHDVEGF
jgi:hypothetical protein